MIATGFFVFHVQTSPFEAASAYQLQFYASLSQMMSLFGGILLKTETQALAFTLVQCPLNRYSSSQDEDEYGAAVMAVSCPTDLCLAGDAD